MTPRRFIIGVCSFSESHRKRACRETWMRDSTRYSDLELVFFEGNATAASREGDVVRLPVPDDYRSLFTKVTSFLSYCLDRYDFEYLFKCDDDTYVHLPRLMEMDLSGADYAGFNYHNRGSATGGGGYWLSQRAARIIVGARRNGEGIDEDVLVGEILRAAGIGLTHVEGLPPRIEEPYAARSAPLPWNDRITGHYTTPEQMYAIRSQWGNAHHSNDAIVIHRARWGTADQWVDVTDRVRASARASSLGIFKVTPALFGDPAPGKSKALVIDTEWRGVRQRLSVGENFSFLLLADASNEPGR